MKIKRTTLLVALAIVSFAGIGAATIRLVVNTKSAASDNLSAPSPSTPITRTKEPIQADEIDSTQASVFPIIVDYSKPISTVISDLHYQYVEQGIQDRFPRGNRTGTEKVNVILVKFGRYLTCHDAVDAISSLGLRPARIEELLSLVSEYPIPLEGTKILALGSIVRVANQYVVPSARRTVSDAIPEQGRYQLTSRQCPSTAVASESGGFRTLFAAVTN